MKYDWEIWLRTYRSNTENKATYIFFEVLNTKRKRSNWKSQNFFLGVTEDISCITQSASLFSSGLRPFFLLHSRVHHSSLAQLQLLISNAAFLKLSVGRGNTSMKRICSWGRRNTFPWSHCKWNEKCVQEEVLQITNWTELRHWTDPALSASSWWGATS